MKKEHLIFAPSIALLALTACGDTAISVPAQNAASNSGVSADTLKTEDDLPNCTAKREESVVYIKEESAIRICISEKWETVESITTSLDDLPNCSDKRESSTSYVLDEHDYFTCSDGRWTTSSQESKPNPKSSSSSSKTKTESDDEDEDDSSSSTKTSKSSSSKTTSNPDEDTDKPSSSSSKRTEDTPRNFLKTLIYDTDQTLNKVFTSDPDMTGFGICVGVHQDIVNVNLGENRKPEFSESANAVKCIGDANNFNTLFNYTAGVNEVVSWMMPFSQNDNGTWTYDSDYFITRSGSSCNYFTNPDDTECQVYTGGFFPIDNTSDLDVISIDGKTLGPLPAARTKRAADAPVPVQDTIVGFEKYCNTPGWAEGHNCEGLFSNGESPAIWNWMQRDEWRNVTRNHHFCMELHGEFIYSDDQEAYFTTNGDLWVFIGNKLAVDLGGNHLKAPGYVKMSVLNETYSSAFKNGKEYPIDIFYCARRTTMSGFSIATNFQITQQ